MPDAASGSSRKSCSSAPCVVYMAARRATCGTDARGHEAPLSSDAGLKQSHSLHAVPKQETQ